MVILYILIYFNFIIFIIYFLSRVELTEKGAE
jgi:hypothetical protein